MAKKQWFTHKGWIVKDLCGDDRAKAQAIAKADGLSFTYGDPTSGLWKLPARLKGGAK